ncbi:MAG: DUF1732 domain-containing protein, partial [Salinisphaera sp.]|nr:DUF1732 domain-containing protein [Salinisphaera sp.]
REVDSRRIGEFVMAELRKLDHVGYVRFASVYRAFQDVADFREELDRLDSHITALGDALAHAKPVGRRLDFLMQEFNREANTLASKSQDAAVTHCALEMTVLI